LNSNTIAEWVLRLVELPFLPAVIYGLYRIVKALSKFETLLANYPPHRHINGSVIYPEGYEPPVVQKLPVGP